MERNNVGNQGRIDSDHIVRCLELGDDFAFEMRVLNLIRSVELRRVELRLEHGGTYVDPVTKFARQFDFRLRFSRMCLENRHKWNVRIALECKQLHTSSSLVVLRSNRNAGEATHYYLIASAPLYSPVQAEVKKSRSSGSLYARDVHVGRSLTQIKAASNRPEGDGEIYTKWSQALASVDDLVWEGASEAVAQNSLSLSVALPFLVIPDGSLWVVDYDDEGNRGAPEKVESCEYYVGKPASSRPGLGKFSISHLHIFTLGGLRRFLIDRINDSDFWRDHFPID